MLTTRIEECIEPSQDQKEQLEDLKLLMYFSRNGRWCYMNGQIYQITLSHQVETIYVTKDQVSVFDRYEYTELPVQQQECYKRQICQQVQGTLVNSVTSLDCVQTAQSLLDPNSTQFKIDILAKEYSKVIFNLSSGYLQIKLNLINYGAHFVELLVKGKQEERPFLIEQHEYLKKSAQHDTITKMFLTAAIAGDHVMLSKLAGQFPEYKTGLNLKQTLINMFNADNQLDRPFDGNARDYGKVLDWFKEQGYALNGLGDFFRGYDKQQRSLYFYQSYNPIHKELLDAALSRQLYSPEVALPSNSCAIM